MNQPTDPPRGPCKQGHPVTWENTYVEPSSGRGKCRRCMRERGRRQPKQSREYNSWVHMKQRCLNPSNKGYKNYGGRGIIVCLRWLEPNGQGFRNFLEDMGPRPEGTTIDRIDNDGNYEPGNCRWADRETQNWNRRRPKLDWPSVRAIRACLDVGIEPFKLARLFDVSPNSITAIKSGANWPPDQDPES